MAGRPRPARSRCRSTKGEVYALQLAAKKDLGGGNSAEHIVLYFYLWPSYARDPQDGMVVAKVTAPLYNSVEETVEAGNGLLPPVVYVGEIVKAAVLVKARHPTRKTVDVSARSPASGPSYSPKSTVRVSSAVMLTVTFLDLHVGKT